MHTHTHTHTHTHIHTHIHTHTYTHTHIQKYAHKIEKCTSPDALEYDVVNEEVTDPLEFDATTATA